MSKSYGERWDELFNEAEKYPAARGPMPPSEIEEEMQHMSEASRNTMAALLLMLRDAWDRAQKYSDALAQKPEEY